MLRRLRQRSNQRQVKAPKVYVRDSGVLHHLLGIRTQGDLLRHPKMGASWEGYIVEQLLQLLRPDEALRYKLGPRVVVVPVAELAAASWSTLFQMTNGLGRAR